MEKTQDNCGMHKNSKRFLAGIILIISSSIIGWVGLFVCNALAFKFGKRLVVLGTIIYALSWIPFGIGFLLAGAEGVKYAKEFFKRIFK